MTPRTWPSDDEQGGRHLAARVPAQGAAAQVGGRVGDEERLRVPGHPAGDSLAGRKRALRIGREADAGLDLQLAGLRVLEGEEAAVGPEGAR